MNQLPKYYMLELDSMANICFVQMQSDKINNRRNEYFVWVHHHARARWNEKSN